MQTKQINLPFPENPQAPFLKAAMVWYLLGAFADELSSGLLHWPSDYQESNPFARSFTGHFVWGHAVVYDLIMFSLLAALSLVVFYGLRKHVGWWAQVPGVSIFMYYGLSRYIAALTNLWITISWYHP